MQFDDDQLEALIAALTIAASRREAQARFVKNGRHHDEQAAQMRRLQLRFRTEREQRRLQRRAGQ